MDRENVDGEEIEEHGMFSATNGNSETVDMSIPTDGIPQPVTMIDATETCGTVTTYHGYISIFLSNQII